MYDEREIYAPLVLFEYDHNPGNYCLMLSDSHMVDVIDVFEERGHEGGGYDWEAVARQIVRAEAPGLAQRVDFDPEAGMFVAFGSDLEALQLLGRHMHEAFHNRDLLVQWVEGADPDWFD